MPQLKNHGKSILAPRVLNVDPYGVWILANEMEYFLDHNKFPWFQHAKLSDIFEVHEPHPNHLRWQRLDIDLDLNTIKNMEHYPLIAN